MNTAKPAPVAGFNHFMAIVALAVVYMLYIY